MSQFGMQMPGGARRRAATMNIYTGMVFLSVVALAVATAAMYQAGAKVGPDGNAFKLQEPNPGPNGYKLATGR